MSSKSTQFNVDLFNIKDIEYFSSNDESMSKIFKKQKQKEHEKDIEIL